MIKNLYIENKLLMNVLAAQSGGRLDILKLSPEELKEHIKPKSTFIKSVLFKLYVPVIEEIEDDTYLCADAIKLSTFVANSSTKENFIESMNNIISSECEKYSCIGLNSMPLIDNSIFYNNGNDAVILRYNKICENSEQKSFPKSKMKINTENTLVSSNMSVTIKMSSSKYRSLLALYETYENDVIDFSFDEKELEDISVNYDLTFTVLDCSWNSVFANQVIKHYNVIKFNDIDVTEQLCKNLYDIDSLFENVATSKNKMDIHLTQTDVFTEDAEFKNYMIFKTAADYREKLLYVNNENLTWNDVSKQNDIDIKNTGYHSVMIKNKSETFKLSENFISKNFDDLVKFISDTFMKKVKEYDFVSIMKLSDFLKPIDDDSDYIEIVPYDVGAVISDTYSFNSGCQFKKSDDENYSYMCVYNYDDDIKHIPSYTYSTAKRSVLLSENEIMKVLRMHIYRMIDSIMKISQYNAPKESEMLSSERGYMTLFVDVIKNKINDVVIGWDISDMNDYRKQKDVLFEKFKTFKSVEGFNSEFYEDLKFYGNPYLDDIVNSYMTIARGVRSIKSENDNSIKYVHEHSLIIPIHKTDAPEEILERLFKVECEYESKHLKIMYYFGDDAIFNVKESQDSVNKDEIVIFVKMICDSLQTAILDDYGLLVLDICEDDSHATSYISDVNIFNKDTKEERTAHIELQYLKDKLVQLQNVYKKSIEFSVLNSDMFSEELEENPNVIVGNSKNKNSIFIFNQIFMLNVLYNEYLKKDNSTLYVIPEKDLSKMQESLLMDITKSTSMMFRNDDAYEHIDSKVLMKFIHANVSSEFSVIEDVLYGAYAYVSNAAIIISNRIFNYDKEISIEFEKYSIKINKDGIIHNNILYKIPKTYKKEILIFNIHKTDEDVIKFNPGVFAVQKHCDEKQRTYMLSQISRYHRDNSNGYRQTSMSVNREINRILIGNEYLKDSEKFHIVNSKEDTFIKLTSSDD